MNSLKFNNRTTNYLNQVKGSFVYKALGILVSFISIPLMIKYLGNEQYGIWSTILAIFSWIVLFDVGIGNGVRNKLAESLAQDNKNDAQKYVSTGYITIGVLTFFLFFLFNIMTYFIDWQKVFNTTIINNNDLHLAVSLAGSFLILNFLLSLINQIANGLQKSSIVVFNQFLSNLLALTVVYILYKFAEASLIKVIVGYSCSLVISNLLVTFWMFKKYTFLIPKLRYFSKKYIKSLTSLGFKFFIIQIAVVVIFTTDKIMITQLFGPEYVTSYDVVFKLFSIITILHTLVLAPLWSACSDAYHKGDIDWIRTSLIKQLKFFILIVFGTVVVILIAKYIIAIWIGDDFIVENSLIFAMAIFVIVSTWNNIFAYIINATNQLKIQVYTSLFAMMANIPLSIILVRYYNFGVDGIVYGTICSLSFFAIFGSMQTFNLIFKKSIYAK